MTLAQQRELMHLHNLPGRHACLPGTPNSQCKTGSARLSQRKKRPGRRHHSLHALQMAHVRHFERAAATRAAAISSSG